MSCRKVLRSISISAMSLVVPAFAAAQLTPVIFERAAISIEPKLNEGEPLRLTSVYDIEVRPEDALRLEYIHTLNRLDEKSGVAIVFTAPTMVPLPRMQVFTPVDALFVSENGTILQIYPGAVLGRLEQDILARDPIKAFVFLEQGQAEEKRIKPGDIITGRMFMPAPPVMAVPLSPQMPAPSDTRPQDSSAKSRDEAPLALSSPKP